MNLQMLTPSISWLLFYELVSIRNYELESLETFSRRVITMDIRIVVLDLGFRVEQSYILWEKIVYSKT